MAAMMQVNALSAQRCTLRGRPVQSRVRVSRARIAVAPVRAFSDTNLIVAGSTGILLALGRFVFLPFQRDNVTRQGLPSQNGEANAAVDSRSGEASFILKTGDPAGFNLVDVFAWGALGHALGFAILAVNSLYAAGVNPAPFK